MELIDYVAPDYVILVDNLDITDKIKDRLINLTLHDEDGIKSDSVDITFSDPDEEVILPRKGVKLSILMGYDGMLNDMGFFVVDHVTASGPPHIIKISAKGAPFDKTSDSFGTLQDIKNRSWTARTLGDLLDVIAGEHNMQPAISDLLKDILLPHIDQIAESDMNLLTRQAQNYDAVFKAIAGRLVFSKKGDGLSISGQDLFNSILTPADISTYSYQTGSSKDFETVKATYHSMDDAENKVVTVGSGEKPIKQLKKKYSNYDAAKAAAEAALKKFKRGSRTIDITMKGNPKIKAGSPVTLSGFVSEMNQKWIVQKVTHKITKQSGFTTEFTAEDQAI